MTDTIKTMPLLLLLALFALALFTLPAVITSPHASLHSEADEIRNCNTVEAIFLNKSCERFNVLKRLDDDRVGNHVVQPCKRGILEVTAYIIGGGTMEEAIATLTAKGCTQIWP